jgi:hypothetical protein
VTLYSGGSSKTDGKPKPNTFFGYSALDIVGIVGAPICILVLLLISASVINTAIVNLPQQHSLRDGFLLFVGIFLIFLFFGWRVDVNEFSLHGFYRNRLARCYLGGTNPKRTPDPFTGFDDHTETANATNTTGIALSDLLPAKFGAPDKEGQPAYRGPFPIFCSTLNLTFGEDLAWQERKGASFAFTQLYSVLPRRLDGRRPPQSRHQLQRLCSDQAICVSQRRHPSIHRRRDLQRGPQPQSGLQLAARSRVSHDVFQCSARMVDR